MNQNSRNVSKSRRCSSVFSLFLMILGTLFLAQNTWAMKCSGTIHLQDPGWSTVQIVIDGGFTKLPANIKEGDWYNIDASKYGSQYAEKFFFAASDWNGPGVTSKMFASTGWKQEDNFSCTDFGAGNDLYIYDNPAEPGKTVVSNDPPNAKYFYVLIPEAPEWQGSVTMISMDGGKTGVPMVADPNRCGWFYHVFFSEDPTNEVLIYKDDDTELDDAIGLNGTWDQDGTPINLADIFEELETNNLFFITDEDKLDDMGSPQGFFADDPGEDVTGACGYDLAAVIYDSDASLHPAFSCHTGDGKSYQEDCQFGAQDVSESKAQAAVKACLGVTTGLVEETLGKDNKPVLSSTGKKCFIDAKYFNQLFNPTDKVNEVTCFNMPFSRSDDGKWEFNSDFYTSPGTKVVGGFYPAELSDKEMDAKVKEAGVSKNTLPAARDKHFAEGPVFYGPYLRDNDPTEGVARIDLMCKGPGWPKGKIDCEKVFNGGDDTDAAFKEAFGEKNVDCGFGWSCPDKAPKGWAMYKDGTETMTGLFGIDPGATGSGRWTSSKGRNQQFCFESHAEFVKKPGLRFTFRGDDDIWVFINKKLVVDLGGTHLAAPGYVNVDLLDGLTDGKTYPIDIFFCDRRTTMSNVRIKTNMYIQQNTGVKASKGKADKNGFVPFEICWEKTGGGTCADVALGSTGSAGEVQKACGGAIEKYVSTPIKYVLVNKDSSVLEELTEKKVYHGGIDLTNRFDPKINTSKLSGLAPGSYKLWIYIDGSKTSISLRVKGNLEVVNRNTKYAPAKGDEVVDPKCFSSGATWKFEGKVLAGTRFPMYVSAYSTDEGLMDPLSAVGSSYSLNIPGVNIYNNMKDSTKAKFPRTIGDCGVDTIYVEVPVAYMDEKVKTVSAKIKAADASVKVYMPELKFIRDGKVVTRDPEKDEDGEDYFNWMGSEVELQLAIYNPIVDSICAKCGENYRVVQTDGSQRVTATVGAFKDGVASVGVLSRKIYYPDSTAFITLNFAEKSDIAAFGATYDHMFFREPPCPYPTLVEIFDGRGAAPKGNLRIPEPLHAENKQYMDGIGDSLVVSYNRLFGKDDSGVVPEDSLPNFICLTWDDNKNFNLEKYSFNQKYPRGSEYGGKPVKYKGRDSLITCSDTIGRAQILEAFKRVGKATRVDEDTKESVEYNYLTFGGLTLSKDVKTYDDGTTSKKVNSWASYEDRGVLNISSFDMGVTERIPPVILKAVISVNSANDAFDDIKFTFSEPLQFKKDADKSKALSYYVFSAATIDPAKYPMTEARYLTPASLSPMAVGPEMTTANLSYQHKKGKELQPTPQNGDYVRFAMNGVEDLLGNSPTDYNAALPSPWTTITGEARSYIVTVPYSTINPNDPVTQEYMKNKTITTVGFFDNVHANADSIRAAKGNTVGHLIMTDMANLFDQYQLMDSTLTPADVYLTYEVYYFTHLGSFVAKSEGKIRCDDASYFGEGEDCTTNPGYFYIGWTGVSNDGRLAGTSAYVSKFTSAVVLKKKKAGKEEETNTFGFRRINK